MAVRALFRSHKRGCLLSAILCLLSVLPLSVVAVERVKGEVKNLAYGEALYQFYQQRYFDAIVHLTASLEKAPMPEQGSDVDLLLGGLYLSYGMHNEAERLLNQLLAQEGNEALRDRIHFYLAKSRFQRGIPQAAERSLKQIGKTLPPELQQEQLQIYGQLLLEQGRNQEAATHLSKLQGESDWVEYGRYNLAIAQLRLGELDKGRALLDSMGNMERTSEEMASLRDRANLTLGSWLLQQKQLDEAKPYLDRIRLNSLLSNDALLATGWSYAEREEYAEALAHWIVLSERSASDPTVQDALLAIPYAFLQLNAKPQAVEHYTGAIARYRTEMGAVAEALSTIQSGRFLRYYLQNDEEAVAPVSIVQLSNYLQPLLVSHSFQTAIQSMKDLQAIKENLALWLTELTTFDMMLAARRENFAQKQPLVEKSLARDQFQKLEQLRVHYHQKIAQIKTKTDALALATAAEKRSLARLDSVDLWLPKLDQHVDEWRAQQRSKFFRGILLWQANSDFQGRLWSAEKGLLEIDQLMEQIEKQQKSVTATKLQLPKRFSQFADRIVATAEQIKSLQPVVNRLIDGQRGDVNRMMQTYLEGQQRRLDSYLTQAQFAIAQIHDSALKQSEEALK